MAEIYTHNYTGRDLMSGGGHTNMQLYSVFLYMFQGVTKHIKQLLLAGQLILTTLWVLSITQEVCPINL